jgi:hypothetical protein
MRDRKIYNIMKEKAATGIGNVISVSDFRDAVVSIATSNNANCKIYCQGAIGDVAPNFAAAQSPTNAWDYIELADLSDSSSPVRGTDSVNPAGTDICKLYEVNINELDWVSFWVETYSAGKITINLVAVDNL